ncbi:hypothetical protein JOB18_034952 [Solea senegalensis]|uniref:Adhesion G protein-coupled receptor B N-terminal domain-containing protein n=1 Tax=Solea senegalensis TaxID=28829 RepID=A0AAV6RAD2_SOLSE|nr:hypothetical protein JOB18_034952 [Solea senegalensis]
MGNLICFYGADRRIAVTSNNSATADSDQDQCHRMNTAGRVCLSVLSSFLAVAGALAAASALALAPLSALAEAAYGAASGIPSTGAEGTPSPVSTPCSSLVAGVLYGSFSLRELFPSRAPGCSWSLENPDPTKYSLYLRFTRHPIICQTHSPMLLSLDHHLANQSCPLHLQSAAARDQDIIDLCTSQSNSDGPYSFLQFDKNFVQLCLTRHPAADEPQVTKELLELRLVEVLLINNENSSQFTCGVLCRWFEECLRTGHNGEQEVSDADGCGMTQTGCICPNHNIMAPPVPLLPETPHSFSNGSLAPDDCCVTELHSNDAIAIAPRDVRQDPYDDDDLKVKTQRPRSADQPGDPAAEEWSQWSVCSLTCGQGWQVRTRSCVSSPYGTLCSGALRETRMCNNTASCPGEPGITGSVHGLWDEWSSWSLCSVTCGRGSRTRTRKCVNGGVAVICGRPEIQTKLCNIAVCPVTGDYTDWKLMIQLAVLCDKLYQKKKPQCQSAVQTTYLWWQCPRQVEILCTIRLSSWRCKWTAGEHWKPPEGGQRRGGSGCAGRHLVPTGELGGEVRVQCQCGCIRAVCEQMFCALTSNICCLALLLFPWNFGLTGHCSKWSNSAVINVNSFSSTGRPCASSVCTCCNYTLTGFLLSIFFSIDCWATLMECLSPTSATRCSHTDAAVSVLSMLTGKHWLHSTPWERKTLMNCFNLKLMIPVYEIFCLEVAGYIVFVFCIWNGTVTPSLLYVAEAPKPLLNGSSMACSLCLLHFLPVLCSSAKHISPRNALAPSSNTLYQTIASDFVAGYVKVKSLIRTMCCEHCVYFFHPLTHSGFVWFTINKQTNILTTAALFGKSQCITNYCALSNRTVLFYSGTPNGKVTKNGTVGVVCFRHSNVLNTQSVAGRLRKRREGDGQWHCVNISLNPLTPSVSQTTRSRKLPKLLNCSVFVSVECTLLFKVCCMFCMCYSVWLKRGFVQISVDKKLYSNVQHYQHYRVGVNRCKGERQHKPTPCTVCNTLIVKLDPNEFPVQFRRTYFYDITPCFSVCPELLTAVCVCVQCKPKINNEGGETSPAVSRPLLLGLSHAGGPLLSHSNAQNRKTCQAITKCSGERGEREREREETFDVNEGHEGAGVSTARAKGQTQDQQPLTLTLTPPGNSERPPPSHCFIPFLIACTVFETSLRLLLMKKAAPAVNS